MPQGNEVGISHEGMKNIERLGRSSARREYERLSPLARDIVNQNVNHFFWARYQDAPRRKLDPTNAADKPFVDLWLGIRDEVMTATDRAYWEGKATELHKGFFAKPVVPDPGLSARIHFGVDSILGPRKLPDREPPKSQEGKRGSKERLSSGQSIEGFIQLVDTELQTPGADRSLAVLNIMVRRHPPLADQDLHALKRTPEGLKLLVRMYDVLVSGDFDGDNQKLARQQGDRILRTVVSVNDVDRATRLIVHDDPASRFGTMIFPIKFTMHEPSNLTAKLTKDGNIQVKMYIQDATATGDDWRNFPRKEVTSREGIVVKPTEIIGVKDYENRDRTIFVPALFLLGVSKESNDRMWSNIENVAMISAQVAGFWLVGGLGLGLKGASAATTRFAKIANFAKTLIDTSVKVADVADLTVLSLNLLANESRGWLSKTYGREGEALVDLANRANNIAVYYGFGRLAATPIVGGIAQAWRRCKEAHPSVKLSPSDLKATKDMDDAIDVMTMMSEGRKLTRGQWRELLSNPELRIRYKGELQAGHLHKDFMTRARAAGWDIAAGHDSDKAVQFYYAMAKGGDVSDAAIAAHGARWDHHSKITTLRNCQEKVIDQWSVAIRSPMIRDKWLQTGRIQPNATMSQFLDEFGGTGFYKGRGHSFESPEVEQLASREWQRGKEFTKDYMRRHLGIDPDTTTVAEYLRKTESGALRPREAGPTRPTGERPTRPTGERRRPEAGAAPGGRTPSGAPEPQLSFEDHFTMAQARNWKADNFWKTPEALAGMSGREGFSVVVDQRTKEVIAAFYDYSGSSLTTGVRAEGFSKLFDAKFDMVVRPDTQGRGIGKLILQKMIDKAKGLGAEHIKVNASNAGSFEWFRRYEPVRSIPDGTGGNHFFRISDLERRLGSGAEGARTVPKPADTLPDLGKALDGRPPTKDTLPDLGKTLDGKPPTAGASKPVRPENPTMTGAPDQATTKPALSSLDARFLGEDVGKKAAEIGMTGKPLDAYLNDKLVNRNLLLSWPEGKMAQVARGQIAKTYDTLGKDLARKATSYGYDPEDMVSYIDRLSQKGLNASQISKSAQTEMKLADYLRDHHCGGDIEKARAAIRAADGDIVSAIRGEKWGSKVDEWNARNPTLEPGRERLAQFGNEANEYAEGVRRSIVGSETAGLGSKGLGAGVSLAIVKAGEGAIADKGRPSDRGRDSLPKAQEDTLKRRQRENQQRERVF